MIKSIFIILMGTITLLDLGVKVSMLACPPEGNQDLRGLANPGHASKKNQRLHQHDNHDGIENEILPYWDFIKNNSRPQRR